MAGMFGWLKRDEQSVGATRSGKWPAVRAAHLKLHPECAACGRRENLDVHHCIPVHVAKKLGRDDLELDPSNLLTVCSDPCHFVHGHLMSWTRYNPSVVRTCQDYRAALERARGAK